MTPTARDDYPELAAFAISYPVPNDAWPAADEADRALAEIDRLRDEVARLRELVGTQDDVYLGTRSHWPDGTPRR